MLLGLGDYVHSHEEQQLLIVLLHLSWCQLQPLVLAPSTMPGKNISNFDSLGYVGWPVCLDIGRS